MEFAISVDPEGAKPPVIARLTCCKGCEHGKWFAAAKERRCVRLGIQTPTVKDGDFCSFGKERV